MPSSSPSKTYAGWINLVLIPLKQHVVCCGVLPLAASALGGKAARVLESPAIEIALAVTVPPVVTYGVMWAEQHWRRRREKARCAHRTLTLKNYFLQTAFGYGLYAAAYFLQPHHHHKSSPAVAPPHVTLSPNPMTLRP